jgi:hypothetical protein
MFLQFKWPEKEKRIGLPEKAGVVFNKSWLPEKGPPNAHPNKEGGWAPSLGALFVVGSS